MTSIICYVKINLCILQKVEYTDDFSDDDYVTYTLENGKLTFTELTGDVLDFADAADMIDDFFPLVFTKQ